MNRKILEENGFEPDKPVSSMTVLGLYNFIKFVIRNEKN